MEQKLSTVTHTPAPWTTWMEPIDRVWRINHKMPFNSVIVGWAGKEADARIIVASLDLLASLKELVNLAEIGDADEDKANWHPALEAARAAIAKATNG